jgi:hypothetical protein
MKDFAEDMKRRAAQLKEIVDKKAPAIFAAAAEKMKDANFSAEGFVVGGSAAPKWPKRKTETRRSKGKRILHDRGTMQSSVKAKVRGGGKIHVGLDTDKVPYGPAHNEGGSFIQYIRPHHRTHYKTGKRYQVKGYSRKITLPQRKYLDYSPDIGVMAERELTAAFKNALK